MPHPISPMIADHILEKGISIAFRQIEGKIFPVVLIFSFITTAYLKKFIGIKSLSTKQCPAEYLPELYPLCSPSYQKCSPSFHLACCLHHLWTVLHLPPSLPCGGNPLDGGRIPPSNRKCSFPTPEISPSPNSNFQCKLYL